MLGIGRAGCIGSSSVGINASFYCIFRCFLGCIVLCVFVIVGSLPLLGLTCLGGVVVVVVVV